MGSSGLENRSPRWVLALLLGALALVALALGASCAGGNDDGERKPGEQIDVSSLRFEDLKGRWLEFDESNFANSFAALHFGTASELRAVYGPSLSAPLSELAEEDPNAPVVVQAYLGTSQYTVSHFQLSKGRLDLTNIVGSGPRTTPDTDIQAPHFKLNINELVAGESFLASTDLASGPNVLKRWDRSEFCYPTDGRTGWALFPAPTSVVDENGDVWGLGATVLWTSLGTVGAEFFMPADGCGFVTSYRAPEMLHPILVLGDQLYTVGSTIAGDFGETGKDNVIIATRPFDSRDWIVRTVLKSDFEGCSFSKLVAREDTGAMTFCLRSDNTLSILTIAADGSTSFAPVSLPGVTQLDANRTYFSRDGTLVSTAYAADLRLQEFSSLLLSLSPGDTEWTIEEVPVPFLSWTGPVRRLDDGAFMSFTKNFRHAGGRNVRFTYGLLEYRDGAITTTRVADWTGGFLGDILPDGTAVFSLGDASTLSVGYPTLYNFAGALDLDGRYEAGNFRDDTTIDGTAFTPPFPPSPQIPPIPHVSGSSSGYVAISNGYGLGYIKPPGELMQHDVTLTLDLKDAPDGSVLTAGVGDNTTTCTTFPCEVTGLFWGALVPLRLELPLGYAPLLAAVRQPNEESSFYGEVEVAQDIAVYYFWTDVVAGDRTLSIPIVETPVAELAGQTIGNDEYWLANDSFAEKTVILHAYDNDHVARGDDGLPIAYPAGTRFLRRFDAMQLKWETPMTVSADAQVAINRDGGVAVLAESGTVGETTWSSSSDRITVAHFSAEDGSLGQTTELDLGGIATVELLGGDPAGVVYLTGRTNKAVAALGLDESSDFIAAFRKNGTRAWTWSRSLGQSQVFVEPPQVVMNDSSNGEVIIAMLIVSRPAAGETDAPFQLLGLNDSGEVAESVAGALNRQFAGWNLSVVAGGPVVGFQAGNEPIELDGELIGVTTSPNGTYVIAFDWTGVVQRSFQMPDVGAVEEVDQLSDGRFVVAGPYRVAVENEEAFTFERGNVQHVHALENDDLVFIYISPFDVRYSMRLLHPVAP